jgi:phospholipase/carboxylesterase
MILGGFYQGSMHACDVVLHDERPPLGLLLFSSTLIARAVWQPRMARLRGLPILQTHGTQDPLLAFSDAEALRDLWLAAGANLTFVPFQGGHTIPPVALAAAERFLAQCFAQSGA